MKRLKLSVLLFVLTLVLSLVSCFSESSSKDDDKATLYLCNTSGVTLYNFSIDDTEYFSSLANSYYVKIEIDAGADRDFYWEDASYYYTLTEDVEKGTWTVVFNSASNISVYEGNIYNLAKNISSDKSIIDSDKIINAEKTPDENAVYHKAEIRPLPVK